ncbi:MAG: haloacid dehalogenase-like hydrolase [Clostridia bacterium]|nr:haloacid dehalogenase-like hydrolase [Clostridia bacterium]
MEERSITINIFDFDGTLTTQTWPKFWVWVKKFGYRGEKRNDNLEKAINEYKKRNIGNELELFFRFFNDLLVNNNETLNYEELMEGERYIQYNKGVVEFIETSTAKNYIVSGGLKEFLQNLKIAKNFVGIYGTPVKHNKEGLITGIGEVMTDDKKVLAIQDILKRNGRQANDCQGVNYIGDGYSDEVAMRFVHSHGGKAIFVHQSNQNDKFYHYNHKIYQALNADGMVDFCCVADYTKGGILSNILKG